VLYRPTGIATDPATELAYFTDLGNYAIRSVTNDGTVSTVAGTVGVRGYLNGTLSGSKFDWLGGLRVRSDGTLVVADGGNHAIRMVDLKGNSVSTLAGNGSCGNVDGPLSSAQLCEPTDVVLGPSGEVYFVQDTGLVRVISGGQVTTLNGGFESWACADDPNPTGAQLARFKDLEGAAMGPDGLLYVSDYGCCQIKSVDPSNGAVVTVLGNGNCNHTDDGPVDGNTTLDGPADIAFVGNDLYILESNTPMLRKADPVAGTLTAAAGTWNQGYADGMGTKATMFGPWGLGPAPGGGLYIGDYYNNRIRRFQP
jgi:sugar lactone lactonase YvrE